jgi:hypothetical protein
MDQWSRHRGDDYFFRLELTGVIPMSAAQILVVEDERLVATALQNELEQFGYQVTGIAATAKDAVDKALANRPDLVLMDIHLQGDGDGIEAAESIQSHCRIPVVYLSAFSDPATVHRASQTQAFGYLLKPYEEQELQTTIEMAIAKNRAELKLEETERWLEAIHRGISDAVIAIDRQNGIRLMNGSAELLTEWSTADAIAVPVTAVCRLVDSGKRSLLPGFLEKVVRERRVIAIPPTTCIISKNDERTPVEGTLSTIQDSNGEMMGSVLLLRNISPRLELERLRKQREQRQQRTQQMHALSRLAGGIAQKLERLLSAVLSNTSLALTEIPPHHETASMLGRVEVSAQSAARMIQRLAMFSQFSEHPLGRFHQIDLCELIPESIDEISLVLNNNITTNYSLGATLWAIPANELLIGQLLLELAINAQDAMPTGGQLSIDVENVALTSGDLAVHPLGRIGDFVRLRIADTGRGMQPEVCAHILEPCFTTKKTGRASGLGLSLVQAVVEQHRGWIECFSKINHGTQFDIYLPRRRPEEADEIAD